MHGVVDYIYLLEIDLRLKQDCSANGTEIAHISVGSSLGVSHQESPLYEGFGGRHMHPEQRRAIYVTRKVREAAGYVELGLFEQALECLDIQDLGPWEGPVSMFKGQILAAQGRFRDAAVAFERAAQLFPPPHDRLAWLTLSHCLRQAGDTTRAIQMLGRARGAFPRQLFLPDSGTASG